MRFFIFPVVVTVLNYLRITIEEEEEERLLLSKVVSLFLNNMSQQGEKIQKQKNKLVYPVEDRGW